MSESDANIYLTQTQMSNTEIYLEQKFIRCSHLSVWCLKYVQAFGSLLSEADRDIYLSQISINTFLCLEIEES